jgi:hypothetical protein
VATLTDALLLAGLLDAEGYLGGELKLDRQRAAQAINTKVGEPLQLSEDAATLAVIDAFEKQAGAVLRGAAEAGGGNLSDATLLAYGGGGPMIACGIAKAAGIRRIIIPHMASVFSAFGIGFSNVAHEYQVPLADAGSAQINAIKARLMERAKRDMYGEGVDPDLCDYDFSLWSVQGEYISESDLNNPRKGSADTEDRRINLKAAFKLPVFSLTPDDGAKGTKVSPTGSAEILLGDADRQVLRGDYLTCLLDDKSVLNVTANNDLIIEVNG